MYQCIYEIFFHSGSPYYGKLHSIFKASLKLHSSFKAGSYKSMEAQNLKRLDLYSQSLTATLHYTNFISFVLVLFSAC